MKEIAIVTGAAMGNGLGITKKLCEKGTAVMMFDMSDEVFKTADELKKDGYEVKAYKLDITDSELVKLAVNDIISHYGNIHILVNNAGVARLAPFEETSTEMLDFHINVNLKGTWNVTQAVIPFMKKNHYGRIVNMSSVTGSMVCDRGYSAYAITKAGLTGFTRSIAREYAEYSITCNALCPGFILTPNVRRSAKSTCPEDPQKVLDRMAKEIPMKRLGTPEDVGAYAAFLSDKSASYITGTVCVIDGGNLIPETNVMGV